MKKSILLISAVLLTLTAFAFVKWSQADGKVCNDPTTKTTNPDLPFYIPKPMNLHYNVNSRFRPMAKSKLLQASSFREIMDSEANKRIVSIHSGNIILIENDEHTSTQIKAKGEYLTAEQLAFLKSCKYSTNLKFMTHCRAKDPYNQAEEWSYFNPHITIVPETQASYSLGKEALIDYLKKGNEKNAYNLDNKRLDFAQLYFTISETGQLGNMKLQRSSGYEEMDKTIMQLMENAPGQWSPARNSKGEAVEQELVVFFGRQGC